MARRRRFGHIERQASGRYRVRYHGPDGIQRSGGHTFETKAEAHRFLVEIESEMNHGTWIDPKARAMTLGAWADRWVRENSKITPRTRELYEDLLRLHVKPQLGQMPLNKITQRDVQRWHKDRGEATGKVRVAHAYKLLRTILGSAVEQGRIAANPCRIRRAGVVDSPERPVLTREHAELLAAAMPEDMQAIVTVTFWAHLRLGELLALRRQDVDLAKRTVTISRSISRTRGGPVETTTKTDRPRTVHLPSQAVAVVRDHLAATGPALPSARLFTFRDGRPLARQHVDVAWRRARESVGLNQFHFHDLRHGGLTLAAQHGASLKELMRRGGHSTIHAAMIYQHAAESRDADLAERMSDDPDEGLDEANSGS